MYVADALELRTGDRGRLDLLTRSSSVRAGLATRARIVLLAAEGLPNTEIAKRTSTSRPTVLKWRGRYVEMGIDGLADEPRPGRAPVIDEVSVLAENVGRQGKAACAPGGIPLVGAVDVRSAGDLVRLGGPDLA